MIYARKGNQITRIDEPQINALVEQGFDIVDDNGTVLHQAVPTDIVLLKKYYVEQRKRIEELEAEVATLKKAAKKVTVKDDTVEVVADEEPKPKRARKAV